MATNPVIPPLPEGFVLQTPSTLASPAMPPLPDGFVLQSKLTAPVQFKNTLESTTAGGKPVSFTGNPFATAAQVVGDVPAAIGKGFGAAGEVARGAIADIASDVGGTQYGGNLLAYAQGQPMPIDTAIQDASQESQSRGEFPTASVLANISQGISKTVPKIAALPAAGEGALAQSLAAGGLFGLQDDGSLSPKEAVIGALMPGVGKLARAGVAEALTKGIESGATALENPLAQKLIENLGEQAALNAYQTVVNSPELIEAYRQDPNQAYAKIAEMVGSNLAFGLLGVSHLSSDIPSATQDFIINHSEKYAAAANKAIDQTLSGETQARNSSPEYQQNLTDAAVANLSPENATYIANNPPAPQQPAKYVDTQLMSALSEMAEQNRNQRRLSTGGIPIPTPRVDLTQAIVQPSGDVSEISSGGNDQAGSVATEPAVPADKTGTAATAEPTPVVAQRETGFTYDGTFQSPNGPAWQFTLRGLQPDDPRFGATFYTPVDAPLDAIKARAKEVEEKFQSAAQNPTKETNLPQLSIDTLHDALAMNTNSMQVALGREQPNRQLDLSELTGGKPLFHETSLKNAEGVYQGLRRPFKQSWTQFYASDNPDLAIGQDGRGVLFEIDPTRVNGWRHYKPGTTERTGFEYNIDRSMLGATKAITFSTERQMNKFREKFPNSLDYNNVTETERGFRVPVKRAEEPQLAIDKSSSKSKIPGGESAAIPQSPVQRQRAEADTAAVNTLQAALSKAYGWNHPLRAAEVRLGVAGGESNSGVAGEFGALETIEQAIGKRVVGVVSDERLPWRGVTLPSDPNTLYINVKAGIPLHAIIGHELIESMMMTDSKSFNTMFDELKVMMRNVSGYQEQLNEIYKREGATPLRLSEAYKELMADFVGDQFTKPEFWDKLERKNPTLFETVAGYMRNLLSRILNALTPFKSEKFFTDVQRAQNVVINAIEQHRLTRVRQGAGGDNPALAIEPFKSSKQFDRIANAPGVTPEGRENLERLAQVQSGDIHPELRERIITRAFSEPSTPSERVAKGLVKKTADLISTHDVPRDFASISDPEQRQAAAVIVADRHLAIQNERAKIERFKDDAVSQMESAINEMANYNSKSLGSDMLSAMANQLPKDYGQYLDNLQRVASPNDNLRATAQLLKQRMSRQAGDFLVSPGAIEKALQEIADNRSIKTGREVEPTGTGADKVYPEPGNKEFLNRVRFAGPLKGVNAEANLLLLGGPDGKGLDGVDPLLSQIKDLPEKIDAIRKINDGASKAMREITDFQNAFNQSEKAVGVGTAMRRYASLVRKSKNVDMILKTLDSNYAKARERLLGADEAHGMVSELMDAPQYKQAVQQAANTLGMQLANAFSPVDGRFQTNGPYPDGSPAFGGEKHQFIITRTPTKEALQDNLKESQALLSDIEQFLDDPNADPIQKQSWQTVHDFVQAQWADQISSPIENPGVREPFDLKHWVPGLQPVRTLQNLVRDQIGGRETYDLRRAMDALDFAGEKVRTLEKSPTQGIAHITLKLVDGAQSHGMDLHSNPEMAERYRADILNPIADSLQHYGAVALKAGDYIPGTATKVTKEDMAALQSLSNFEQAVRRAIENDAQEVFNTGTKIMDEYGGVKFSRMSSPTGPMMLTRFWNDELSNWIDQNWRTGMQGNQREAQVARLTNAMWNDPDMFNALVRGYVFETNPDFSKLSSFAKEFRELAAQAKKNPVTINSLNDLVDAIQPMRPDVKRDDLAQALKADLEREAVRIMDDVSGEIGKDNTPEGVNAIDRAVASSLKTGGAFLDPRGKMLAPQTFYAIAKVAKSDVMTAPAIAITIGRVRVLQGLKEVLTAYSKHRDALELEIQKATADTNPNPVKRSEKIAEIDRAARLGDYRYEWNLLNRRIGQLRQQIDFAEANLTKFSEVFTPGVSRTISALNRGLTMQLLSAPGAVVRNLFGATYVQDLVLNSMFRNTRDIIMSPLHTTHESARVIADRTLRLMEKTNPKLADAIKQVMPFKNELADWVNANQEMVRRLTESGQLPPADILNRIGAKGGVASKILQGLHVMPPNAGGVGFGGEILRPGTEIPGHLQAAQWAFSTPVGLMHEMMFPRAFDNFANTVMAHRATTIMLDAFSHAKEIRDSRTLNGAELDPTNPAQRITAKEMGMNETQLQNFRALLEPIGSLERLMFDYANRLALTNTNGQKGWEVPIMSDKQMQAALLAFGKLGNVLAETNTPAVWRIGKIYRIFGTFGSWPANFFDQLLKLVPNGAGKEQRKMFVPLAVTLAAVTGISIGIQEIRRKMLEAYTGKLSSEPGLANVMEDPTSNEAARYMVGALSGGIPYLSYALGQNTDTQSLFDASRVVPLLGLIKDTISMGSDAIKTGDVTKGLIDFSNRYLPLYSAAINRVPGASDYIDSKNVGAALRAATPRDIEMRSFGGGTANPTPLSKFLRQAETAAFQGNQAGVQSSLNAAINFKMQQKGISRAEAMNELRQSISARQPEMRVYGRTLAPTERQRILSRMDASQLASYHSGQQAYSGLMSMLPHQHVAKASSLFSGMKKLKARKLKSFA